MNESNEIVYVLTNSAMPGLIKIGITSQNDLEVRIKQLYTTGVPVPFKCVYACKVNRSLKKIEDALHVAFDDHRINPGREFFNIEPEKVVAILDLLKTEVITQEVEKEMNEDIPESEKSAANELRKKRPAMNFVEMGIPIGSELLYKDGQTKVKVIEPRKVEFNGEIVSLTFVTVQILQIPYSVQPAPYWTYNGKTLKEIYNETYLNTEE